MIRTSPVHYLLAAAAFVVLIAGMRAAQSLLVPFLLAGFLAIVLTPPLRWLERRRVPTALALLIIVMVLAVAGAVVLGIVGKSIADFSQRAGQYQASFQEQVDALEGWLERRLGRFPGLAQKKQPSDAGERGEAAATTAAGEPADAGSTADAPEAGGSAPGPSVDLEWLDPEWAIGMVKSMIAEIGQWLSSATIIFITVIFMLLEAARLPAKLRAALGERSAMDSHVGAIVENIRKYMAIKTATSLTTGILVTGLATVLGLKYGLLWGLLAFMFNYVPNIGSIIAAVPAVVLALVDHGPGLAAATALGYVVINGFVSYVIEPRFMGEGLGLSTLVVFLSLVFWGWVLGTVGMLLSAPLTMMVKIVLEDFEETRWIAVLLGAKAPEKAT